MQGPVLLRVAIGGGSTDSSDAGPGQALVAVPQDPDMRRPAPTI